MGVANPYPHTHRPALSLNPIPNNHMTNHTSMRAMHVDNTHHMHTLEYGVLKTGHARTRPFSPNPSYYPIVFFQHASASLPSHALVGTRRGPESGRVTGMV